MKKSKRHLSRFERKKAKRRLRSAGAMWLLSAMRKAIDCTERDHRERKNASLFDRVG